jgi:hypothetical protein
VTDLPRPGAPVVDQRDEIRELQGADADRHPNIVTL